MEKPISLCDRAGIMIDTHIWHLLPTMELFFEQGIFLTVGWLCFDFCLVIKKEVKKSDN
jgi:hypothetical protein